jgi:hypothetical protein
MQNSLLERPVRPDGAVRRRRSRLPANSLVVLIQIRIHVSRGLPWLAEKIETIHNIWRAMTISIGVHAQQTRGLV